jgi:cell division protein FtsL
MTVVETPTPAAAPSIPERARPSQARAAAAARALGVSAPNAPSPARAAAVARVLGAAASHLPSPADLRRSRRHLTVVEAPVRTPAQRRRRARAMLFGGGALLMAVAFGLVYLHVVLAQRQFAVDHLNAQLQQEQTNYEQLRLQVAELGSPQHIISTAEGQLGMVQPAHVTYISPSVTVANNVATPAQSGTSGSGKAGSTGAAGSSTASQAPAGDADWPLIKSQLAGSP